MMTIYSVVELDLVGYSDAVRVYEEGLGVPVVLEFNAQIQGFIDAGLEAVNAARADAVMAKTGDGAIVAFEQAQDAFKFALAVHEATRRFNTLKTEASARRWFRIGIATGELIKRRSGDEWEIAGAVIIAAVRLEAAAQPGQILVDAATFQKLDAEASKTQFIAEQVPGKRAEVFDAHRYTAAKEANPSPTDPPTVESVLEMFDHLQFQVPQFNRLLVLLRMPLDHRPHQELSLFERKTRLLDWVDGPTGPGLPKLAGALETLIKEQGRTATTPQSPALLIIIALVAIVGVATAAVLHSTSRSAPISTSGPAPKPEARASAGACNTSIFGIGSATDGDMNGVGYIDNFSSTAIRGSQFVFGLQLHNDVQLNDLSCLQIILCKVDNAHQCSFINSDYPMYRQLTGHRNSFSLRLESNLKTGLYRLSLALWQVTDSSQLQKNSDGTTQIADGKLHTEQRDFTLK